MDDLNDPISQFFPDDEQVDLYAVLSLKKDASPDSIKKSYRKLALLYHPDKHTTSSKKVQEDASTKFQQVGFAYSILSDEKRRARYDSTGRTDDGFDLAGAGEGGWEAYFEDMFDRVTRGKLDEMKKEYQGSLEEVDDLKEAYNTTNGNLNEIMTHIPHSTHDDEPRFVTIITGLIKIKELKLTPTWTTSSKDEKSKMVRKKEAEKEAKEAEDLAKELGVWDEFYGTGKATEKKGRRGKGKEKQDDAEDDDDHSALQALILKKKDKNMDSFFDSLATKYAEPTSKKGKKKRGHANTNEVEESPRKKSRSNIPPPPDLNDAEFAKLQQKLFGDKTSSGSAPEKRKTRKTN